MTSDTVASSCILSALSGALLCLAGCSSTPAKVDTGPIPGRSFAFVKLAPAPGYADDRAPLHAAIQAAIARNLTAKGLTLSPAGQGDLTIGYLVIIGNNATTTSIDDYFGYGADAMALADKAHKAGTGSENPNYFEAGTLVVDVVDTRSFRLLKRNYVVRPILRDPSAEVRQARLQEAVDEVLRDLRIRVPQAQ